MADVEEQQSTQAAQNRDSSSVTMSMADLKSLLAEVTNSKTATAEVTNSKTTTDKPDQEGEITSLSTPNLASHALELDVLVDPQLAKQIVSGQFIDLAKLIPDLLPQRAPGQQEKLRGDAKIYRFGEWLAAMLRFTAVFLKAHPKETGALLKYIEDIRSFQARGINWLRYDEVFRKARAGGRLSWGIFQPEIYSMAMNSTMSHRRQATSEGQQYNRGGLCKYFNSSVGCRFTNCSYRHVCRICSGTHAATACNRKGGKYEHQNTSKRK